MIPNTVEELADYYIARRIACFAYPESEARFANIFEYVAHLEKRLTEASWQVNPERMGQ